ncbi:MAG TPA: DNA polymerase Y family protein [Candidatus Bathyarchaeia archaeon]|nr:DNA polymerase Y family protein [Candidatus Bathyarchaeia archaeon]
MAHRVAGMTRIACLVVPGADERAQRVLLEVALAHSPSVEDGGPGRVYLDLRGLGTLFGSEREIARRLLSAVGARGLAGRIGIAGSRAGARFAARSRDDITIIPPGGDARMLGPAPLALLDLDPHMAARFHRWGIRTLGELADLPARGLAERLGDEGPGLQRLARGEDATPLRLWTPPPIFEESADCPWGIETLDPLVDLAASLVEILCERLSRHGFCADAFEWSCRLADGAVHEGRCAPAAPLAHPEAAVALVRSSLQAHPPRVAVEEITLRACPVRVVAAQPRFDEPPHPSPRQLTTVLTRLSALVHVHGVGSPRLLNTHRPDSIQMAPFLLPSPRPSPQRGEGVHNPLPHWGTQFEVSAKGASRGLKQMQGEGALKGEGAILAMHRFRPPQPVEVALAAGLPAHLRAAGLTGRIVAGAGPWRISGDWWTDTTYARDEWDVELADGTLCRLARDARGWRLEAIYD